MDYFRHTIENCSKVLFFFFFYVFPTAHSVTIACSSMTFTLDAVISRAAGFWVDLPSCSIYTKVIVLLSYN